MWTDYDRITIDYRNSSKTLDNFLSYRRSFINPLHPNDNAQLITYVYRLLFEIVATVIFNFFYDNVPSQSESLSSRQLVVTQTYLF